MTISNSTKYQCSGLAGVALLFILPAAAFAAPVGGVAKDWVGSVRADAPIEKVAHGHCWWRQGVRYCRRSAERARIRQYGSGYGYDYGAPRAEFYPTGSTAWWQAMEREGRTGFPRR